MAAVLLLIPELWQILTSMFADAELHTRATFAFHLFDINS